MATPEAPSHREGGGVDPAGRKTGGRTVEPPDQFRRAFEVGFSQQDSLGDRQAGVRTLVFFPRTREYTNVSWSCCMPTSASSSPASRGTASTGPARDSTMGASRRNASRLHHAGISSTIYGP